MKFGNLSPLWAAKVKVSEFNGVKCNILSQLNKLEQSVESYRKALKYAEITNDVLSRLQIFNLMVQALVKLELHVVIVKEIDEMISKMVSYAYIDLFTIAGFHRQLGHSLFKLDQNT